MMFLFVYSVLGLQVLAVALELWLGVALAGWFGDHGVVAREERPSQYWVLVTLHVFMLVTIDAATYLSLV